MAFYTVTTSNWNSAAFWDSVNEAAPGHALDFSGLPSNYSVTVDQVTGIITISDGVTSYTIGEAGVAGTDANFGGTTLLDYFEAYYGGQGTNYIEGTDANDTIYGNDSDDTIYGHGGNDWIEYGDGDNIVYAGAGDDTVDDIFDFQISGDDTIYLESGNDTAYTGWGDDFIYGGTGDDIMRGEEDSDTFVLEDSFGNDTIFGGETVHFTTDWDTIDASLVNAPLTLTYTGPDSGTITDGTYTATFSGIEEVILSDYNDIVDASANLSGVYVTAGGGDDQITGGSGNDIFFGGSGDDMLSGGEGHDTFYFGNGWGTDTVFGDAWDGTGTGTDTLDFSDVTVSITVTFTASEDGTVTDGTNTLTFDNIETIIGSSADDTIDASADNSGLFLAGGDGNDTITAGGSDDTIVGGVGDDIVSGGAGSDIIGVSDEHLGNDVITGGETGTDNDVLSLWSDATTQGVTVTFSGDEAGSFSFDGAAVSGSFTEIESLWATEYDDYIDASASTVAQNLTGNAGDDTLIGGSGADFLEGGAGDDTLTGGTGDDILVGGDGNDTFIYNVGDGSDIITDFNTGNTGTLSDGDSTNNDFINLSAYYDNLSELYADQLDDGILNQSNTTDTKGRTVDYSDNSQFSGGSITFTGASGDNSFYTAENTAVTCYLKGTRILTPNGEVPIDRLQVGDLVVTRDHGAQKIRWIGMSETTSTAKTAPIRIRAGALGRGVPHRDLRVSPQHRMLLRSKIVAKMIGVPEVLVPALRLTQMPGIRAETDATEAPLCYLHLMCNAHEVIYAEGAPAETLLPGPQAETMMDPAAWEELVTLFPDIKDSLRRIWPARTIPSVGQQKNLLRRHLRNEMSLLV